MRIRQIVFAAHGLHPSQDLLAGLLQLTQPFRDPGVAEFGIDNAVFCFGDQFIEVISPTLPDTACSRHLARQGDSGYMLILQTDDLARERARFAQLGVRTVWSAEFDDISAVHLHPKDVGAAIVSVDQPRPAASWRWGGPQWQVQQMQPTRQMAQAQRGRSGSQRVRGITLRAHQPQAMARRWAEVLGSPAPTDQGGGWRVALDDGFADFQPTRTDSTAEGVAGFTLAVADPQAVLARALTLGLPVVDGRVRVLGAELALQALEQQPALP
jgi:hypothetical protein